MQLFFCYEFFKKVQIWGNGFEGHFIFILKLKVVFAFDFKKILAVGGYEGVQLLDLVFHAD